MDGKRAEGPVKAVAWRSVPSWHVGMRHIDQEEKGTDASEVSRGSRMAKERLRLMRATEEVRVCACTKPCCPDTKKHQELSTGFNN